MLKHKLLYIIICCFFATPTLAQKLAIYYSDSSILVAPAFFQKDGFHHTITSSAKANQFSLPIVSKQNRSYVDGFVSYEFLYRSQIDTPFAQQDYQQHTERLYLKTNIFKSTPTVINISARQTNSPFFRDRFDLNFRLDINQIKKQLVNELKTKFKESIEKQTMLKDLNSDLKKREQELTDLYLKVNNEKLKELVIREQTDYVNSHPDSIIQLIKPLFETDTLNPIIETQFPLWTKLLQLKKELITKTALFNHLQNTKKELQNEYDSEKLRNSQLLRNGLTTKDLKAGYKNWKESKTVRNLLFLNSIKTLEVGRCNVNYTELTAQNLLINGINIEVNPSYYFAIAKGNVFNPLQNIVGTQHNQSATVVRVGRGHVQKKALIFTYYKGSQRKLGYVDTVYNKNNFSGLSLQYLLSDGNNKGISIEVAKSSTPAFNNEKNSSSFQLFNFDNFSNGAILLNGYIKFNKIKSNLTASLRKQGLAFQNLNLFNVNSEQSTYKINYQQELFKQTTHLRVGAEKATFNNGIINRNYNNSFTLFTSLLSFRKNHWPTLDIGYMPSRQIVLNQLSELQEYLFANSYATVSYLYKINKLNLNTLISAQDFRNVNKTLGNLNLMQISIQQWIYGLKHQWNFNVHQQKRQNFSMTTYEMGGRLMLLKNLKFNFLEKLNRIDKNTKLGHEVGVQLNIPKLGIIEGNYIENFITNFYNTPVNYKMARFSFLRYF